jgi:hypothetical protein
MSNEVVEWIALPNDHCVICQENKWQSIKGKLFCFSCGGSSRPMPDSINGVPIKLIPYADGKPVEEAAEEQRPNIYTLRTARYDD